MGIFAGAFTASSLIVFAIAHAIGQQVTRTVPAEVRVVGVLVALLVSMTVDGYTIRRKTWCPGTPGRQTPKMIYYRQGARRAALAWGLDTGLVVTTYRVSSLSWALLLLGLMGVTPWWLGLAYSAGFVVPLWIGCSTCGILAGDNTAVAQLLTGRQSIGRLLCISASALSFIVIIPSILPQTATG